MDFVTPMEFRGYSVLVSVRLKTGRCQNMSIGTCGSASVLWPGSQVCSCLPDFVMSSVQYENKTPFDKPSESDETRTKPF